MSSQIASSTRPPTPTLPRTQPYSASQPATRLPPTKQSLRENGPTSRSRPTHTQSAPVLSAPTPTSPSARQASNPQQPNMVQCESPSSPSASERNTTTRGYAVHLPHNPSRPPPYIYQRKHEFPPFPPLMQHPVLPFLTTAFCNQPDGPTAPVPKPQMTIAPRASTTQRHVHSNFSTIPTMDVSKNDPTATFLRPPLVVPLPRNADPGIRPEVLNGNSSDSEPAPGTPLTYAILHNHRNWFLDADDFRKDNPNRIDYPPELEPPRGWAPLSECTGPGAAGRCKQAKETKEKNSRTKGSYAHADKAATDTTVEYGPSDDWHEKTVLRCTFCRREYHGPNAKSMWRRHVYDKHKVAMKNRREGSAGMAPKVPLVKKGKMKAATPSPTRTQSSLSVDTPALTLDLINEQNLIRLLERVVSGNLDINLPASLLNGRPSSDGSTPGINLEAIALALQKSGISLTLEKGPEVNSISEQLVDNIDRASSSDAKRQSSGGLGQGENIGDPNDVRSVGEDSQPLSSHSSTLIAEQVAAFLVDVSPQSSVVLADSDAARRSTTPSPLPSGVQCYGQKRKADASEHHEQLHNRVPLKDNTTLERNNHNSNTRVVPATPLKDKGKQKTTPRIPGYPNIPQSMSPISSSPQNPYTPHYLSATALRARALATTGQESYLTLVLSSPATASPVRCTGRVSFTSPYSRQTSPTKVDNDDRAPRSDDPLGILGTSSPRYPFDFNIEGTQSSPSYMTAFDPIPLELGTHSPAQWTSAPLGPPAPLSETTSRSISRASSVTRNLDTDEDRDMSTDDDQEMQLEYPEWSSPSERLRRRPSLSSRLLDADFDMDAFLDLDDAAPAMSPNLTSPHKTVTGRGFSKEFGLLSPQEVERITASARLTLEEEARSSKRQKVDCSS